MREMMLCKEVIKAGPDWKPGLTRRKAGKVLTDKLLSIGGLTISDQYERNLPGYAAAGRIFDLPVQRHTLEAGKCHENVASIWHTRPPNSQLVGIARGYGLSSKGIWHPHSWALGPDIVETVPFEWLKYFGVHWTGSQADTVSLWFLTQFCAYRFDGKRYSKNGPWNRALIPNKH